MFLLKIKHDILTYLLPPLCLCVCVLSVLVLCLCVCVSLQCWSSVCVSSVGLVCVCVCVPSVGLVCVCASSVGFAWNSKCWMKRWIQESKMDAKPLLLRNQWGWGLQSPQQLKFRKLVPSGGFSGKKSSISFIYSFFYMKIWNFFFGVCAYACVWFVCLWCMSECASMWRPENESGLIPLRESLTEGEP